MFHTIMTMITITISYTTITLTIRAPNLPTNIVPTNIALNYYLY